jgi:hypothetical protein
VLDQIFMLLGENTKMPCITIMAIDTDVVARTVALKYENQPDADVRALEYLGKIMQLSVGLPEPRQAELERLVLEASMPSKAGGRPHRTQPQAKGKAAGGTQQPKPGERSPYEMVRRSAQTARPMAVFGAQIPIVRRTESICIVVLAVPSTLGAYVRSAGGHHGGHPAVAYRVLS